MLIKRKINHVYYNNYTMCVVAKEAQIQSGGRRSFYFPCFTAVFNSFVFLKTIHQFATANVLLFLISNTAIHKKKTERLKENLFVKRDR